MTNAVIPPNLSDLKKDVVQMLDDYIVDAMDSEDGQTLWHTTAKGRLADFILYVSVIRDVNLLNIMNDISTRKEGI